MLENGAYLCVSQVSPIERKKGEKSIFDHVWFSMRTAVLEGASMCTGSIAHVDNDSEA